MIMEFLEPVVNLINNMGFPIACVLCLFYLNNKQAEQHRTESEKWLEAINRNTNVMEKLMERLDK